MNPKNPTCLFPLFITRDLSKIKRWYVAAGFVPTIERDVYLQLRHGGEGGPELCFMLPGAAPVGGAFEPFAGRGVAVSIPTPDADDKRRELVGAGLEPMTEVSDKPWGWRSFLIADPCGVVLDFFHVTKEPFLEDEPRR